MQNIVGDGAWITSVLKNLPRVHDPVFTEVWGHHRFTYKDQPTSGDEVDLASAHFVGAAMHESRQLLVVLPDRAPHRPPLLLATCLVMDAIDNILFPDLEPNKVIYFGTTIGIREQIGAVKVHDLALDKVFPTYRTSRVTSEPIRVRSNRRRRTQGESSSFGNTLPQVICVYAPADPREVIDQFEPTWLAVDCSDTSSVRWLPSLLSYAKHLDLPVVAWSQSPLADTARDFAAAGGLVFRWPKSASVATGTREQTDSLEKNTHHTTVTPVIIQPANINIVSALQRAYSSLLEATRIAREDNRLLRDTLNIGWRYLQALELLPIPLDLYDAEVQRFWNSATVAQLQQTFERFIDATKEVYPRATTPLLIAHEALSLVHTEFATVEPPIWTTLLDICLSQEHKDLPHILVFTTEARRQLFSYALLSRYNLSEQDLQTRGIWLTTLKAWYREYASWQRTKIDWEQHKEDSSPKLPLDKYLPIIVGLPSFRQSAALEPLFDQTEARALIYGYQQSALVSRVSDWNDLVEPSIDEQTACLAQLASSPIPRDSQLHRKPRIVVTGSEAVQVVSRRNSTVDTTAPWKELDPVQELTRLFGKDEEGAEGSIRTGEQPEALSPDDQAHMTWTEKVISVHLEGGWCVDFAVDDKVQLVAGTSDAHVEERYVRSIRRGDRILFIAGQQRQSLYDLIITRVHAHPAIELHLAMIRRWHAELPVAYKLWKKQNQTSLEDLLGALNHEGSRLMSTQTLRLWLSGQVLCPEDPLDLQRLAKILEMPFVRENYRPIAKAARRLRSIHVALANKLNRWLQREALGALSATSRDTSILDKELGLTFSDFRDSLQILRVEAVTEQTGLFLRNTLGKLEKGAPIRPTN